MKFDMEMYWSGVIMGTVLGVEEGSNLMGAMKMRPAV